MHYRLRIWAMGGGQGIVLSEQEYSAIANAMERLSRARDTEEKLDLLLENLAEYEGELLALGVRSSLFPSLDDHRIAIERQLVNRRIMNLLSSARMYVDQVKHSVSQFFGSGNAPNIDPVFSAEYDSSLEYRVAEALRNFAQHRAFPVHVMIWPSAWEDQDTEKRRVRFGLTPFLSVEELESEGGLEPPRVMEELRRIEGGQISLTLIVRRYLESLGRIQEQIRQLMADQLEKDNRCVVDALHRARGHYGDRLMGLVVSKGADDRAVDEHHFVNEKPWVRREFLIAKSRPLVSLSRRYVSAEHPGTVD